MFFRSGPLFCIFKGKPSPGRPRDYGPTHLRGRRGHPEVLRVEGLEPERDSVRRVDQGGQRLDDLRKPSHVLDDRGSGFNHSGFAGRVYGTAEKDSLGGWRRKEREIGTRSRPL